MEDKLSYVYKVSPTNGTKVRALVSGDIVRHFKGNFYSIVGIAKHTETGEDMVIYSPLYVSERTLYARPYDMFMSKVDKTKYPNADQEYRFEIVKIQKNQ